MFINQKGLSIVELLIAIGLAAILFPALLTGFVATRGGRAQEDQRILASSLLQETQEAVRQVRDKDWNTFAALSSTTKIYYPVVSGSSWTLLTGPEPPRSDGFTRTVKINDVSRDNTTKLIVAEGSANSFIDPSTRKILAEVSWGSPIASQIASAVYLTRFVSNSSFTDTTDSDFKKGMFTSTEALNDQVVLAKSTGGDWCDPGTQIKAQIPLDKNQGFVATKVIAGINRAFASTGKSNSGKPLFNVDTTDATAPKVKGFYDASLKTHDLFGESHYAYLAPESSSSEAVVIVDVNSDTPTFVSSVTVSKNKGASSVFVSGNTLYFIGNDNNLYVYSMSADRKTLNKLGSLNVGASNKIFVVGSYVFIAMDSTSNQLQIINATDPSKMKKISSLTVNNQPAVGIFVLDDRSRAYIVTNQALINFFIIDTSDPNNPSIKGSGFGTDSMAPKGLTVIDNRAIIVGFAGSRYKVLRVGNDAYDDCTPNFTADDDIWDVSSIRNGTHAYSYIVTDNNTKAFQIIEGGVGGAGGYVPMGIYESGTSWPALGMPTTFPTAFNHFDVKYVKPAGTDLAFQVAVADTVAGSCSNFSYVGPGQPPTSGSFSTLPSSGNGEVTESFLIPSGSNVSGYLNPGKCFRYKATLKTGSNSVTPAINEVTVNYSP